MFSNIASPLTEDRPDINNHAEEPSFRFRLTNNSSITIITAGMILHDMIIIDPNSSRIPTAAAFILDEGHLSLNVCNPTN